MTFELLDGVLTAEPEKVSTHEVLSILGEMPVGEVSFLYEEDLMTDYEGTIMLSLHATLRDFDEDEIENFIRVIRTDIGFVVDRSHSYEERAQSEFVEEMERIEAWVIPGESNSFVPVVGIINSPHEFDLCADVLKAQFNIEITAINAY